MSTKKPVPSEGVPTVKTTEPVLTLPVEKSPEELMFEKVNLMASLTAAIQSPTVKTTFEALPCGDQIYNLLVKAVHQEIQSIMGKSDKDTKELSGNMQQMAVAMSKFVNIVNMFNDLKLVGVLSALNQKLTPLGDLNQPQQFLEQPQHNHVDHNSGQQVSSSEQVYVGPGQRAPRNPGVGSF